MRKYFVAVEQYAANPTDEGLKEVQQRMSATTSKIDKAVKVGVLHRNNAARKKSRLDRFLKRHQPSSKEAAAS